MDRTSTPTFHAFFVRLIESGAGSLGGLGRPLNYSHKIYYVNTRRLPEPDVSAVFNPSLGLHRVTVYLKQLIY